MVLPEDAAGGHGIHDIAGPLLVGGVDFLASRTALFRDPIVQPILNSQQSFEAYLEFLNEAFKIAATQMVSMIKSPADLFAFTKDDKEIFEFLYAEYIAFQDLKPFLGYQSNVSIPANISTNRYKGHIKFMKDELLIRLYRVRRSFVYRKCLLKLDFIQWDSDPEEVLKRLKSSNKWSDLGDRELKHGLKRHMRFLKEFEMSKLNLSCKSSSTAEFENIALEKINLELGSELEKRINEYDYMLMDHYFNRMKWMNLARECATQAQKTGIIFVEEAIPIRAFSKEPMLSTSPNILRSPYMKQTVKQALEGSMSYLKRINEQFQTGAARVKALPLIVGSVVAMFSAAVGNRR